MQAQTAQQQQKPPLHFSTPQLSDSSTWDEHQRGKGDSVAGLALDQVHENGDCQRQARDPEEWSQELHGVKSSQTLSPD